MLDSGPIEEESGDRERREMIAIAITEFAAKSAEKIAAVTYGT